MSPFRQLYRPETPHPMTLPLLVVCGLWFVVLPLIAHFF